MYGLCCALGVLNGAQGPQAFSPPVVQYILHEKLQSVQCPMSCVPDITVRASLLEIENITNAEAYMQHISISELCKSTGCDMADFPFKEKTKLLNMLAAHHTIGKSLAELHQFIEGLKVFNVLDTFREYPVEAANILQLPVNKMTADKLDNLFGFSLSPEGSNRNEKEKAILFNWRQLLEDVEEGDVVASVYDEKQNENVQISITLSAILAFITGSPSIPPLGFSPGAKHCL